MSIARFLLAATGVTVLLAVLPTSGHAAAAGAVPAPRQVPGLTAADAHPNEHAHALAAAAIDPFLQSHLTHQ